jgi:hypothetical protein
MGIYKFLGKGPAYGLGYLEGELVEIDEAKGINAIALVNEVYADGPQKGGITGKMVQAPKNYTVDYLSESGVIRIANKEEREAYKNGNHINAIADGKAIDLAIKEDDRNKALGEKIAKGK